MAISMAPAPLEGQLFRPGFWRMQSAIGCSPVHWLEGRSGVPGTLKSNAWTPGWLLPGDESPTPSSASAYLFPALSRLADTSDVSILLYYYI